MRKGQNFLRFWVPTFKRNAQGDERFEEGNNNDSVFLLGGHYPAYEDDDGQPVTVSEPRRFNEFTHWERGRQIVGPLCVE